MNVYGSLLWNGSSRIEENVKAVVGFLKQAVEVGIVGGWEVGENKFKNFEGEQGRASLSSKRRETWWGIQGIWQVWITRGESLRELMMFIKQWAWWLIILVTETDIKGEFRKPTGTGARAEIKRRARGEKAETRITSLRFNYNEKQKGGKKEQSVTWEAAGTVW